MPLRRATAQCYVSPPAVTPISSRNFRRPSVRRSEVSLVSGLAWFLDVCESFEPPWRLDGIRPDIVDERLGALTADGKSARSVNIKLEAMRAFLRWSVQHGRLDRDPLRVLKKRNEVTDRRLIHRVLTEVETNALLAVAREAESDGSRGRWLWYALPLYAGLRRGDLVRLVWDDVDLSAGTVIFRGGKARHRVDCLPLRRELQDELVRVKPANVLPSARVFPRPVSNATRQKDYGRAGIVLRNEHGTADLHSLRATFATRLAARGTAPAVLQRLMRHSTPTLTMKYYVHLEVESLRSALESHARVAANR